MENTNNILKSFETAQHEDWIKSIEKSIKQIGTESLNIKLEEDLIISPVDRSTSIYSIPSKANNQWLIVEYFDCSTNHISINKKILNALMAGANALRLEFNTAPTSQELESLFNGILPEMIQIQVISDSKICPHILDFLVSRPHAEKFNIIVELKDHGTDKIVKIQSQHFQSFGTLIHICPVTIDPSTEGLSNALYAASLLIDKIKSKNELDSMKSSFGFKFSASNDYILNIAALRAFRKLWALMIDAYAIANFDLPFILAKTNLFNSEDSYQNMISNAAQALSLSVGNADAIWTIPSDNDHENTFSTRIARNIQHILQQEAHINKVVDPAAGAHFIEQITTKLIEKAWQAFCDK